MISSERRRSADANKKGKDMEPKQNECSAATHCSLPFVTPVPHTGPVTVIREKIESCHGVMIYQYGGSFRMVRFGDNGFKVSVSAEDALWIIDTLMLGAKTSTVLRRSVVWSDD